jgi:ABC-type lipoprotein release transport system permease subunit
MARTFQIAWRNLGRNRRRTALTGLAVMIGVSLSVVGYGLTSGMLADMLQALTRFELGHVQIHHPEYPRVRSLEQAVANPEGIGDALRGIPGVHASSRRVYAYALVSHGDKSLGAELVGIEPLAEQRITVLHERVVAGRFLDEAPTPWPRGRALTAEEMARDQELTDAAEASALAEIDAVLGDAGSNEAPAAATVSPNGAGEEDTLTRELAQVQSPPPERPPRVFLGEALARALKLEVGGQLHVTTNTIDGTTEEVFLEVAGTFRTGTPSYDRSRIYLHLADMQRLVHLYDAVHEIAIVTDQAENASQVAASIRAALGSAPVLVRSWGEIRPDLERMVATSSAAMGILAFIIILVAVLGVINTMLMAVFERTREFGMLKAIGMSGWRIVGLVVTESALLVLMFAAAGAILGVGMDLYLVHHGIDLTSYTSRLSVSGIGLEPVLHGKLTAEGVIIPVVIIAITCLLASLYPAVRAARMPAAVGMRET